MKNSICNYNFLKSKMPVSLVLAVVLFSCSVSTKIAKRADKILMQDSVISTGHIGISIYEPATNNYWYNYNADKYFTPASNAKLFTLYAGMKYLGDSLVGLRYRDVGDTIIIYPNADPTFLHADFSKQPIFDLLASKKYVNFQSQYFTDNLGKGWAWDDYQEPYMVQRNEFPMYGNMIRIYITPSGYKTIPDHIDISFDRNPDNYNDSLGYDIFRDWKENKISLLPSYRPSAKDEILKIPLAAGLYEMPRFLMDTLHNQVYLGRNEEFKNTDRRLSITHSQPTDSLLTPMMHRSDNFFAEQTLLMVSNERLGFMNDEAIIDSLLNNELKDIPHRPTWVDGSGLSRYNLFTPQSFIYILNKMKNEFGLERLKGILPTGGEGTLSDYYTSDRTFIYAKTGTLGGTIALSGFLITKKNKLLVFSILTNNFKGRATAVRRAVEQFVKGIRENY